MRCLGLPIPVPFLYGTTDDGNSRQFLQSRIKRQMGRKICNLQFAIKTVKRSDPEKNPKRYPEQKRGKEPLTEERRIYRSLV